MIKLRVFEYILIGLIGFVLLVVVPVLFYKFDKKQDACDTLGGTMVKTTNGWLCVKLVPVERLS